MVDIFAGKSFEVEHCLSLYADSFIQIPAEAIYDEATMEKIPPVVQDCHIYLIGLMPNVDVVDVNQEARTLTMVFEVLGKSYDLKWQIPDGLNLIFEDEQWFLSDGEKREGMPSQEEVVQRLRDHSGVVTFNVQYVGQAYGANGSRNAMDRLMRHETLQKIAIKGIPQGYKLQILMLAIQESNTVLTMLNPFAENMDDGDERIASGNDKLFGTSEQERVSLYEAALIRYFSPIFNKEFRNSFPSTNLKVLQDCYDKDFSALVAEINFDTLPYYLCSSTVDAAPTHTAFFDLHEDEQRKAFFA